MLTSKTSRRRAVRRAMPNILLAWELGSGLGHLGPLRAIGVEFVRRGHRVAIVTNNMALCQQGFAGTGIDMYPAPMLPFLDKRLKVPCTYSDILHDCGYSSAQSVQPFQGWHCIGIEFPG